MSNYPESTAQRLCEIALAEVGYIEQPVNVTKYGKDSGADGLPWCGSFVMWCATKIGLRIPSVSALPQELRSSRIGINGARHLKGAILHSWTFQMTALIASHTSASWSMLRMNSIICVEGNTSGEGDQRNGGMVMIKKRTIGKGSHVVGYGVPRFSLFEGDFPIVPAPDSALAKPKKKKRKHGKSQGSTSELVA
jgi:hypothetical protein